MAAAPVEVGSAQDGSGPADEVPHSSSFTGLMPAVLGPLIALATLVVPLATVISSDQHAGVQPHQSSHGSERP